MQWGVHHNLYVKIHDRLSYKTTESELELNGFKSSVQIKVLAISYEPN